MEIVPFRHVEIDRAVPWRDRHDAGTEFRIDRRIFDDRRGHRAVDPFDF